MCGRIAAYTPPSRVARALEAGIAPEVEGAVRSSFNVPPTRRISAVRIDEGGRLLDSMRWGLVPHWAKDPRIGAKGFNARAETVASKPMFRAAFERRRALIPVDGFYEWHRDGSERQPYFFRRADGDLTVLAGLFEYWEREGADGLLTCCILTTEAGEDMAGIHHRMPVVLGRADWVHWLDPDAGGERVTELLVPAPGGTLRRHPVAKAVGSVRNDRPELVEELVPARA